VTSGSGRRCRHPDETGDLCSPKGANINITPAAARRQAPKRNYFRDRLGARTLGTQSADFARDRTPADTGA